MADDKMLDFNVEQGAEIDVSRKVRVGIIGCGWIAEAHVKSYKNCPDVEIVAGADIIPGKAKKFFEKTGVEGARCYESTEEMLKNEQLDAVSVCTYNSQHAPCAIAALEACLLYTSYIARRTTKRFANGGKRGKANCTDFIIFDFREIYL